jgi:hypothetical protein
MSDTDGETEEEGPAIPLGEGEPVEGAPLSRVTSRLHYAIGKSDVVRREGDTVVRTPDGPRELASVLEEVEAVYFDTRQALERAVRDVIGTGPIPTAEPSAEAEATEGTADADAESDDQESADAAEASDESGAGDGEETTE